MKPTLTGMAQWQWTKEGKLPAQPGLRLNAWQLALLEYLLTDELSKAAPETVYWKSVRDLLDQVSATRPML